DRASGFEPEGREFESLRAREITVRIVSATHHLRSGGFELPTAAAGGAGGRQLGESPSQVGRTRGLRAGGPERGARDEPAQRAGTAPWRRTPARGGPARATRAGAGGRVG